MNRVRWAAITGTLDTALDSDDTTMESVGLEDLPAIASGGDSPPVAVIVLDPAGVDGTPECVYVTDHAEGSSTATIVRGQEQDTGHSAGRSHGTGRAWAHVPTPADYGVAAMPRGPRVIVGALAAPRTITATIENGSTTITLADPEVFTLVDSGAGLAGTGIDGGTTISGDPTSRTTATMSAPATADATIEVTITPVRHVADVEAVYEADPGATYMVLVSSDPGDTVVALLPDPWTSLGVLLAFSSGGPTAMGDVAQVKVDARAAAFVAQAGEFGGPAPDPAVSAWVFQMLNTPAVPGVGGWLTVVLSPDVTAAAAGLPIYPAPWSEAHDAFERQSQGSLLGNVATFSTDKVRAWFITPETDQWIDGLQWELVTAGGAGATGVIGLYEAAAGGASGDPLLEISVDVDTATATIGYNYETFTPMMLTAGQLYVVVVAVSDDDVEMRAPDQLPGISLGSWQNFANEAMSNTAGWTYGALPEGSTLELSAVHDSKKRPHIIWHLATAP